MQTKPAGKKRPKPRLGDVVAIPLPDGRYAFARLYRSNEFGVLRTVSSTMPPLEDLKRLGFAFFLAGTDEAIKRGDWPIVAEWPFASGEEPWAPPKAAWYLRDLKQWTTGSPKVTHRDEIRAASETEVAGMDIASFCQTPELFVRVLSDRLIQGLHDPYVIPRS